MLQFTSTHLDLRATGMPERFIIALDYNEFTDVMALCLLTLTHSTHSQVEYLIIVLGWQPLTKETET